MWYNLTDWLSMIVNAHSLSIKSVSVLGYLTSTSEVTPYLYVKEIHKYLN